MIRTLSLAALPALLAISASAQESNLPADFAALVPNDAVVLLRLRSSAELADFVERIRQRVAPDEEALSVDAMVSGMLETIGVALDGATLDPNMPAGVTFVIDPQSPEPRPTFILPAKDVQALLASVDLPAEMYTQTGSGAYVALALGGQPAGPSGGSRLVRGGPEALVSARVDLGKLINAFGPLIEMQLDQLDMMLGSGAMQDESMPFDMTDMYEWYLQLAWDIVDSADLMDIAFDVRGGELVSSIALTNRKGSPLAALGKPEPVDYRAALAQVDPDAPFQMVMRYDQSGYMDSMWSIYDGLFEGMEADADVPAEVTDAFRAYMGKTRELMKHAGTLTAASMDFGAGGFRMAVTYHSDQPVELMKGWIDLMSDPALAEIGLATSSAGTVELGGVQATAWTARVDMTRLMTLMPDGDRPNADELAEIQSVVDAMIGPQGLSMAMMPQERLVGFVAGGDLAWRAGAAERLVNGDALPPHLARAADALAGANPGMLMSFDLHRGLGSVLGLLSALGKFDDEAEQLTEVAQGLGDAPIPCSIHWGVRGPVMQMGMSADLDGILRMVELTQARAQEAEQRVMALYGLSQIENALQRYAAEHDGALPDTLDALTVAGPGGEPYFETLPKDPWGRPYHYEMREDGPFVWSLGADGKSGGQGAAADLTNRDDPGEPGADSSPFVYEIF